MKSTGFAYIYNNGNVITKSTGYSHVLLINVRINVIDPNGVLIPNSVIELYQNGMLIESQFTDNGIWAFELPAIGNYEVSTSTSDRKQSFTWDGVNIVKLDFIVYGVQHQYRIKAKGVGAVGDSEWSEILTRKL